MRKVACFLSIGVLFSCFSVHAVQTRPAADNARVDVRVAAKSLSRLAVMGDRIKHVRGVNGSYTLVKDEEQGAVFIQPTPYYANRPFDLFVTTEQGHTYHVFAVPRAVPSETINIRPLSPVRQKATHWERQSPYVETLTALVTAMIQHRQPDGYAVLTASQTQSTLSCAQTQLVIEPLQSYRGGHLQGEDLLLRNTGKQTCHLTPNQFVVPRVRAVSLQAETLRSGETTHLYRIIDHA